MGFSFGFKDLGVGFRVIIKFRVEGLESLVPSLIEGPRVVQGLRVVPVFSYRYSMIN